MTYARVELCLAPLAASVSDCRFTSPRCVFIFTLELDPTCVLSTVGQLVAHGSEVRPIWTGVDRQVGDSFPGPDSVQSMLAQLADRLILQPSRNPISAAGKVRRLLTTPHGFLEVWTQRVGALRLEDVDIFVLKFSGAGGRAERTSHHPLDAWADLTGEIWSVNPHGYGGSSGPASLQTLAVAARAAYNELASVAVGRPICVMGNSLGTVLALHLAATHRVDGLVLRNPPPLRQLIVGRHGWWNLWLGAMLVSTQVPDELCSIANARQCADVPALFIGSVRDRVVPPHYQAQIVRAYAGPKRIMRLREADHDAVMTADEQERYRRELRWLREKSRGTVETD